MGSDPVTIREVAHDLRNLLTAIRGRAELLVAGLGAAHPLAEDAAQVLVVSGAAFDLLDALDAPADAPGPGPTDLDAAVLALGPVVHALVVPSVRIELDLRSGAMVAIGRRHLERVLVNLVLNAREAMPDGGRLCIRTVLDGEVMAGVEVADSGPGFADDALRHLFEPGFTTRRERGGSGSGLASCRRIVEAAGGTVSVASHPGAGAEVRVRLPIAAD